MRIWTDFEPESGRRLRQTGVISAVAHLVLFSLLLWLPSSRPSHVVPQAITVSLLSAVPAPPAPKPVVKAAPKAPTPKAKPKAKPRPKVKVLPKKAPTPVAKAPAKPRPKPAVKPKPRPEELSYDDALAKLRGDLGESPPVVAAPTQAKATAHVAATAGKGVVISAELAAWNLAVKRHVKSHWIMPPEFRESGLAAALAIWVQPNGAIRGQPQLLRTSGNPYYDDNAIRALSRSSPLPPPPAPGRRVLILSAEE